MEYSTILRTQIRFGEDTWKVPKTARKKNITYNHTTDDQVATWYSAPPPENKNRFIDWN